jgi:hypothetical protein
MLQFLNLFNIVHKKHGTIAKVFSSVLLSVSVRRALIGNKLLGWNNMMASIANVNLQEGKNTIIWSFSKNYLYKM